MRARMRTKDDGERNRAQGARRFELAMSTLRRATSPEKRKHAAELGQLPEGPPSSPEVGERLSPAGEEPVSAGSRRQYRERGPPGTVLLSETYLSLHHKALTGPLFPAYLGNRGFRDF